MDWIFWAAVSLNVDILKRPWKYLRFLQGKGHIIKVFSSTLPFYCENISKTVRISIFFLLVRGNIIYNITFLKSNVHSLHCFNVELVCSLLVTRLYLLLIVFNFFKWFCVFYLSIKFSILVLFSVCFCLYCLFCSFFNFQKCEGVFRELYIFILSILYTLY